MSVKFFAPTKTAPHPLGTNLARAMRGPAFVPSENHDTEPLAKTNLHYGILHGGVELQRRCLAEGRNFVHVDHGFWGRTDNLAAKKGWFRFQLNSQASHMGRLLTQGDYQRIAKVQRAGLVDLQPRRTSGTRVVYQPPSEFMREHWHLTKDFNEVMLKQLRMDYPSWPILIHEKGPLKKVLDDCRLFVSFNSTAGYRALELGIDMLSTCQLSMWPYNSVAMTDQEFYDARNAVFTYMAGRCFEWSELEDGTAFIHMMTNGEIP